MASRSRSSTLPFGLLLAVVAAGLALRVLFLGSDPTYPFWSGWITDEGRWTELAREWVLFGAPDIDTSISRIHLLLGPVFQLCSALAFKVLGVGTVSARAVSVVFGAGILVVAGLFLRRRIGPGPALGTVALLAVQPDLVYFSRVAIPEMTALFFQLVAFTLIVGAPRTVGRAALGGLAMAVAIGVKGTVVLVAPFFALIVMLTRDREDPHGPRRRLVAFLGGLAIPALAAAGAYLARSGSGSTSAPAGEAPGSILAFLELDSAYGMAATLYDGGWTVHVNIVLVVLWSVAAVIALRRVPPSEAGRVFAAALLWVAGWGLPWAVLLYFPERYVAHIHLPLILALGAGYAVLRASDTTHEDAPQPGQAAAGLPGSQRGAAADASGSQRRPAADASGSQRGSPAEASGSQRGAAAGDSRSARWAGAGLSGTRRWAAAAVLAAPLAATLGPLLISALGLSGVRVESLGGRLAAMTLLGIVIGATLVWRWSQSSLLAVATAPPAVALAWWVGRSLGLGPTTFWPPAGPRALLAWTGLVAVAAGATWILVRVAQKREHLPASAVLAYAGILAAVWIAEGAGRLANRSHVVDQIQEFLISRYEPDRIIGVVEGTSIFLDTPFRYREFDGVPPDVVVVYWRGRESELPGAYREVADIPLEMGAGYVYSLPEGERVRVFERESRLESESR